MSTKSDFMAAEEIKAILTGREQVEQERIIRWVNESLGLAPVPKKTESPVVPPSHTTASTAKTSSEIPVQPTLPVKKDIRSFVDEKKPKSDVQFAVVAAYFYRFIAPEADRKDSISAKDLDESGRQARGYGFKKSLVTLSNARASGYFDSAGRGAFKLNAVGENLVAMALPGADAGKIGVGRGIRKGNRPTRREPTRRTIKKKSALSATASVKRSKMSAAGRARIAAAQKARWAKIREKKSASAPKP